MDDDHFDEWLQNWYKHNHTTNKRKQDILQKQSDIVIIAVGPSIISIYTIIIMLVWIFIIFIFTVLF